jgi:hypothetical protein
MSPRDIAEIQLRALLNDPVESMPRYARGASAMSLEEASKQLNIPPFMIERLLKIIDSLFSYSNVPPMSQNNMMLLTRILNSTLDVRVLIFFMMLDEDDDNYVTRDELSQFFKLYFKTGSLSTNRVQEAVPMVLQRFHLETVRFACSTYYCLNFFFCFIVENSNRF